MVIPFQVISNEMVPFLIIILLTLAENGLMVPKQLAGSSPNPNLISSLQRTPFEMDVPSNLEALGSRVTVRVRVSPNSFLNNSEFHQQIGINSGEMYLQLGVYERNRKASVLTQQNVPTLTTNWQEVTFDCGWIVKGGKYFVRLVHFQSKIYHSTSDSNNNSSKFNDELTESSSSSHDSTGNDDGAGDDGRSERVLVTKTITVKYPTILFEVPTRLETYTTAAPVTFGLTRTICKPKLKLPSTVLTLTMCSLAVSDSSSGPNHFSSHHQHHNHHHSLKKNNKDKFGEELQRTEDMKLNKSVPFPSRDRHHHRPDAYLPASSLPTGKGNRSRAYNHSVISSDGIYSSGMGYDDASGNALECHRDVTVIYKDPLMALQVEGRVTINVECQLWGRNATYVIQLQEVDSRSVIAQSSFIKVEWSSQFSLKLSKNSVLRCQGSIRVIVSHPECILPGRDKVRVYGYETLPVPSLLAPKRVSYIGEQQIKNNNRILSFRCDLFPSRFLRFCFHYVNTAVDESVAVVEEKCIPTGPANKISDGGWSSWSKWSSCSVTCGTGGKRFRYRFCDSPPPTTGANFCQGKAIQEEPCDSGIPCPPIPGRRSSTQISPTGEENYDELGDIKGNAGSRKTGRPNFMDFSVLNVSTTPGCECGCILYDLIPTKNYSLVILISANQSSCADEDEQDHHNFRWILHAKDEKERIRLDIVGMDMQCVTMTFRDGNTTDSNLLEVITASQPSNPIQFEGLYEKEVGQKSTGESGIIRSGNGADESAPFYSQYQYEDDDSIEPEEEDSSSSEEEDDDYDKSGAGEESNFDDHVDSTEEDGKDSNVSILRIESTGSSLSIGTTTDSSKNCSGQFIYFIAYYTTIPVTVTGVAERKEEKADNDFWQFLIVKILVLFFIAVVVCSTIGGCFTKMYAKYKYKELKYFENDEDQGSLNEEELMIGGGTGQRKRGTLDDSSRCTSITLMSFDHSYWRRLRILRLKYFLLKPRPLDPDTAKIKSFPNTPTVSIAKMKVLPSTSGQSCGENVKRKNGESGRSAYQESSVDYLSNTKRSTLIKPISFSESNLGEKAAILAVTQNGYEIRRTLRKKEVIGDENSCDHEHGTGNLSKSSSHHSKKVPGLYEDGSVGDMNGGNVSMTSTSASISISVSSTNSFPTPTPTPTPSLSHDNGRFIKGEVRNGGEIKLLKEQENLKRRAGKRQENKRENASITPDMNESASRSQSGSENSHRAIPKRHLLRLKEGGKGRIKHILKHGDSTASVSTVQSTGRSATGDEDDSSRVASRSDLDDTDQDFEMDYYDYDVMNAGNIPGSYLGLEPAFVVWNSDMYPENPDEEEDDEQDHSHHYEAGSCLALENAKGAMDDSAYDIEMTPSTSSIGMFSQEDASPKKDDLGIKETSLDTLKFADDDDDGEDILESYSESMETLPLKRKLTLKSKTPDYSQKM